MLVPAPLTKAIFSHLLSLATERRTAKPELLTSVAVCQLITEFPFATGDVNEVSSAGRAPDSPAVNVENEVSPEKPKV